MTFSIEARYPLGVYRGRQQDGRPETFPSVARLHSALLCAAGFGPRAVQKGEEWGPCEADEIALRWLEENPPTDVTIPEFRLSQPNAIAYRDDGTIRKSKNTKVIRKLPKLDCAVAVKGPFVWSWRESPPEPVVEAVRELCADVPHLGPAESPVALTVTDGADVVHTHEYVPNKDEFTGGSGVGVAIPVRGRLDELVDAHRAERTGKVGSDRAGTDERAASTIPPRRAVRSGWYQRTETRAENVPWPDVLVVPLDREVPARERVRVAVAAHKALIKILGEESPPVLTGSYADGIRRAANRVALQVLDKSMPVHIPADAESALAVLLPQGADAQLDAVFRAVASLRVMRPVHGRGGKPVAKVKDSGDVEVVPGAQLWKEPAAGMVRLWRTAVPAVPDTRGRAGWTFTHAALLSLGFVWKDTLPAIEGRGAERDNALVDAVNAAGAVVLRSEPFRNGRVQDFAHHVHRDAVVRPYEATLALGGLAGSRTVQAIGQARHLGGGLLVPYDRTEGELIVGWPG